MSIKRILIIPLKEGKILDEECIKAIIICPTMNQAKEHLKNITKNFPDYILKKDQEVDYGFSNR